MAYSEEIPFKNWSPLHYSIFREGARQDDTKISELLITNGFNIEIKDSNGNTPIFYAVKFFNLKILDILIKKGADISIKNNNNKDVFDIILDKYYDEQTLDEDHIYDENSDEEKKRISVGEGEAMRRMFRRIDAIIKNGFDINSGKPSPTIRVLFEIHKNNMPFAVLKHLFDYKIDFFEYIGGDMPLIQALINIGAPVDIINFAVDKVGINYIFDKNKNHTPLTLAVNKNNIELVKIFIEKGADFKSQNNRALKLAEERGYFEIVDYLKNLN